MKILGAGEEISTFWNTSQRSSFAPLARIRSNVSECLIVRVFQKRLTHSPKSRVIHVKNITKRPPGLVAIVIYKIFSALLLAVIAIALGLTVKEHQLLVDFSESCALEGKLDIIKWTLDKILNFNPKTLQFTSIAVGLYAILTAIEGIGLWYQKGWAKILVLVLVGISIPPEIFELFRRISLLKLAVFLVNLAVFWYLLRHSLSTRDDGQSQ
ncbi:DUF2127 domain-containing protein [Coleofasciculus sp. FACHB-129]|nr:DUF2127 domain-containing protein [Coleofasciculus sp. FACHB-129]